MARTSRQKSNIGTYHIVLRGVNRQDLFFDDEDREMMLKCFTRFQQETDAKLLAYCLMTNHIHLLLQADEQLGLFIKKVASSYVFYFNRKYDRVGHLFQDRFRSEAIEDERYLLAVFRYILQNPWKAGICRPDEYRWSSWNSLDERESDDKIAILRDIAGDLPALKAFVLQENEDAFLEAEAKHPFTEAEALAKAMQITGGSHPLQLQKESKEARDRMLVQMKRAGISVRQISRLTGLNRNVIQRAK